MAVFILITRYMFMLFLFLGSNSIVLMLLYLEVLSWLFVMLISPSTVMKYLVIQAYFIILGLLGVLWMPLFLVLRLFLKIGLPPMHVWFLKLSVLMGKWVFIFFSTLHKLLPLLLLGRCFMTRYLLTRIILLVSTRLIYQIFEFLFIIMTSSMVHRGWILLGIQLNLKTGLVYWTIYSLVFLFLLRTLSYNSMFRRGVEQSTNTGIAWLAVSGIPPFIIFWIKVLGAINNSVS